MGLSRFSVNGRRGYADFVGGVRMAGAACGCKPQAEGKEAR